MFCFFFVFHNAKIEIIGNQKTKIAIDFRFFLSVCIFFSFILHLRIYFSPESKKTSRVRFVKQNLADTGKTITFVAS